MLTRYSVTESRRKGGWTRSSKRRSELLGGIGVKRPVAEEGKVSQVPAYSQHCTQRRPFPLRVNLMRHNSGEHEIPRFSLIRPQWRFPDKPGRSLFFFCLLHIRTAVFFTTMEPQPNRVLELPRGLGERWTRTAQNSTTL